MKKEEDPIMFNKTYRERLECDASDVYFWLKIRDEYLAERFRIKLDRANKLIDRKLKKRIEEEESAKNSMTWKMEYKDSKVKTWLRRYFGLTI